MARPEPAGTLRIVAGRHRGRRIAALPGAAVRPTGERARAAVFDILLHGAPAAHLALEGAAVLDAFAGTGALGLEALSRGAAHATFLDRDQRALALLRANVALLDERARATVLAGDATRPPPAAGRTPMPPSGGGPGTPVDLAFLDPPYQSGLAPAALAALAAAGWFKPDAILVVECAVREAFAPPAGFEVLDERRYGAARVRFLRHLG